MGKNKEDSIQAILHAKERNRVEGAIINVNFRKCTK